LSLMGHKVKVFEKREQLGGMLRYGIPSYRLPRERLQEDIDAILSVGVEVETNYDMANEEATEAIRKEYDAMYIGIGAHIHKQIGIPGEYSRGVISAVEMLRGIGDGSMPDFAGKEVVVIGGGNVAMDVARTAKRLGASNVSIVYRRRRDDMTALPEEIDGAVVEGCDLLALKKPARIEANAEGAVQRLWVKPQIIGTNDSAGRPSPVDADLPEEEIPCQIIISAIGQATDTAHFEKIGIPVNRGNIKAQSTSGIDGFPGIFAGGDCVTGPSTVIAAIAAGKVAAANIDAYLGYHHEIEVDVDIPEPRIEDKPACGRIDLRVRLAKDRGGDFMEVEQGMTAQEAMQEASRCLRCDRFGYSAFRGGRTSKW
ncbi:MAG: FAD-dependent oxidoreductase, partial [Firmicutes bacterium]|nr:FAD-dependent oxidoreductase [Bacillota bacterium]